MPLAMLLVACVNPVAASIATPTPPPTKPVPSCEPTRARDAGGVITVDGRSGVVGDTFTDGGDMNGTFWLVRRGAAVGDSVTLFFRQIGTNAPATSVWYGASASSRETPWGDAAFSVGWKPISFKNSCWSLIVDGADTGIVLAVGY
jgi:hypothetical protein